MEKLIKSQNGQWSIQSDTLEKGMGNKQNQLGISPEGKLKFDPGFGQKEFREYVKQKADHMCKTGYLAGEPDDWNWHYDPEYNLEKLAPIKKNRQGWIDWFHGEMTEWVYDHGDERKGHFEKWAQNPEKKPLIIVEGTDGKDHQIDGHHRAATAFIKNFKTVPVIYGRRKSK